MYQILSKAISTGRFLSNGAIRKCSSISCVLVAAARSRRGASSALLLRLLDRTFVPAISVPLFVEYEATLLRSENLLDRDAATVESFLDFLLSVSHLQDVLCMCSNSPFGGSTGSQSSAIASRASSNRIASYPASGRRPCWSCNQQ